jgi:hypothetical protein
MVYVPTLHEFEPETTTFEMTVAPAGSFTLLEASRRTSHVGQPLRVVVRVAPAPAHAQLWPAGQVQLLDGAQTLGTATLTPANPQSYAIFDVALRTGGITHSLFARYSGDGNHDWSLSPVTSHYVYKGVTATGLTQSSTSSVYGEPVTLTASPRTYAPAVGLPAGRVTFTDAAAGSIGWATPGGKPWQARLVTGTIPVGSRKITATYEGSPDFEPSTSTVITHTVYKATTATSLAVTPSPSAPKQNVRLYALVSAVAPSRGFGAGQVQFFVNGRTFGPRLALNNGSAFLDTTTLSSGRHIINVQYFGDSNFWGSWSPYRSHEVR